jgi:hypothetical protein
VPLVNVDRFDRVTLEFHSQDIEEPVPTISLKFSILGATSGIPCAARRSRGSRQHPLVVYRQSQVARPSASRRS